VLADYYASTGQIDKAKAEFASLAQKYPKNLAVQEGYVRILIEVKDYATAQSVVTELMKKNSKDPQVAVLNGIVLLNNGKTADAVNALQDCGQQRPQGRFHSVLAGQGRAGQGRQRAGRDQFPPGGAVESPQPGRAGGAGAHCDACAAT
jgi:predicted Zn-dependent protease